MLKNILKSQRILLERRMKASKIIKRERDIPRTKLIKVITGVRRCGKSFFTYLHLMNSNFAYANFDDERLLDYKPEDIIKGLIEVYGDFNKIFFDEVQNFDSWELFVNRLHREGFDIFITGSSAKLLSKELATHLTGRSIAIDLFPFSFREFLNANEFKIETERDISLVKKYLEKYIEVGGFPEVVVEGEDPIIYLSELYTQIITKDIVIRYNIKYKKTLRDVADYLLSNISNYVTYNSVKKHFNIASEHTVKNYFGYLEEAFLFIFLDAFSFKVKEIKKSPKKIYAIDTGFFNALGFKLSENIGRLMENLVVIELMRRKSYHNSNIEIYYFKTKEGYEVDFLIKEGLKIKQLIQVTYANSFDEIDKIEIRALIHAYDLLKDHNPELICITWDYEDEKEISWFGKKAKIKFVPLWKWMLNF